MFEKTSETRRNVIPRWKPLALASTLETSASEILAEDEAHSEGWLGQAQANWELNPTIENAVDLMDAAVLKNDRRLSTLAAAQVVASSHKLSPRIVEAAASLFRGAPRDLLGFETDAHTGTEARRIVRALRARVEIHPRDSLALVELARLQALFGSREHATISMNRALHVDPDSRYVLRAATRLFTFLREQDRALYHLRRTDRLATDPLLQSAEIATSELAGKASKIAGKALRRVKGSEALPLEMSELGMALATLEEKSGAKRRDVFRFISGAMHAPTENALAQAIWLVEHVGFQFKDRFGETDFPADAAEARALQAIEFDDYRAALSAAYTWFRDQPFQSRAPQFIATVNFSFLNDYKGAFEAAESGLQIHPSDWRLVNSALIARALNGDLTEADNHLRKLKALVDDDASQAFLNAAQGMLSFCNSDIESGNRFYEAAMLSARKANRPDLVVAAAMYYAEMSARSKLVDFGEIIEFCNRLESVIDKRFGAGNDDTKRLWRSRRAVIADVISEAAELISEGSAPEAALELKDVPQLILDLDS